MFVKPTIFQPFAKVVAAMSTRRGGVSLPPYDMNLSFTVGDEPLNVQKNRDIFFGTFGITESQLAIPQQQHTTRVLEINSPGVYENCDGLVTDVPRIVLTVTVADCAPVLLYDKRHHAVALLHAGWRGTAGGIVRQGIALLRQLHNSKGDEIVAFVGPSAGECCYEVGEDVAQYFSKKVLSVRNRKLYLNIKQAIRSQLFEEGISERNMEVHSDCTICQSKWYHSFRRDQQHSGRMIAFIELLP